MHCRDVCSSSSSSSSSINNNSNLRSLTKFVIATAHTVTRIQSPSATAAKYLMRAGLLRPCVYVSQGYGSAPGVIIAHCSELPGFQMLTTLGVVQNIASDTRRNARHDIMHDLRRKTGRKLKN